MVMMEGGSSSCDWLLGCCCLAASVAAFWEAPAALEAATEPLIFGAAAGAGTPVLLPPA